MFSAVLLHSSCCSGKTGHLPKVMQLCNFMVIIKHFGAKHHSSKLSPDHTYYCFFLNLAIYLDLPLAGLFSRNMLIWYIPNTRHLSRVLVNKSEAERWLDRNPSCPITFSRSPWRKHWAALPIGQTRQLPWGPGTPGAAAELLYVDSFVPNPWILSLAITRGHHRESSF